MEELEIEKRLRNYIIKQARHFPFKVKWVCGGGERVFITDGVNPSDVSSELIDFLINQFNLPKDTLAYHEGSCTFEYSPTELKMHYTYDEWMTEDVYAEETSIQQKFQFFVDFLNENFKSRPLLNFHFVYDGPVGEEALYIDSKEVIECPGQEFIEDEVSEIMSTLKAHEQFICFIVSSICADNKKVELKEVSHINLQVDLGVDFECEMEVTVVETLGADEGGYLLINKQ